MAGRRTPAAPKGLGARGRGFWREIQTTYELDPGETALLAEACRTADELQRVEQALATAPLLTAGSTGQDRAHPLLEEARRHRATLLRLLQALQLPADQTGALSRQQAASAAGRRMAAVKWAQRRGLHGA
jgi:hypothetical protein